MALSLVVNNQKLEAERISIKLNVVLSWIELAVFNSGFIHHYLRHPTMVTHVESCESTFERRLPCMQVNRRGIIPHMNMYLNDLTCNDTYKFQSVLADRHSRLTIRVTLSKEKRMDWTMQTWSYVVLICTKRTPISQLENNAKYKKRVADNQRAYSR